MKKLPSKDAVTKEISGVLVFKVLFLAVLWFVCFSHPLSKYVNDKVYTAHLIGSAHALKLKHKELSA